MVYPIQFPFPFASRHFPSIFGFVWIVRYYIQFLFCTHTMRCEEMVESQNHLTNFHRLLNHFRWRRGEWNHYYHIRFRCIRNHEPTVQQQENTSLILLISFIVFRCWKPNKTLICWETYEVWGYRDGAVLNDITYSFLYTYCLVLHREIQLLSTT